jgi:hypothetical protein
MSTTYHTVRQHHSGQGCGQGCGRLTTHLAELVGVLLPCCLCSERRSPDGQGCDHSLEVGAALQMHLVPESNTVEHRWCKQATASGEDTRADVEFL